MDRTYVTRRLSLSEYGVLSVLDEPVIEELEDIDIKLFEGDNYIYLMDMQGNKFYAEYLVKNDFTDLYVTTNQMNSSIKQTAEEITSSVSQIYATKETTNELSTRIKQTAKSIELTATDNGTSAGITIRLKNEDGTQIDSKSANITMNGLVKFTDLSGAGSTTINGSNITTGTIDASKVTVKNLNASNITSGTITGRAISGGTITGTSITNGSNFSVDKNGNMTCKNANITGGSIKVGSNFNVNSSGNMTCSNANITGRITSTEGKIAGFTIGENLLSTDKYGFNSLGDTIMWVGTDNPSTSFFLINRYGVVQCNTNNSSATEDKVCGMAFNWGNYFTDIKPHKIVVSQNNESPDTQTIITRLSIVTPKLTQTSLASSKKNFEKLENALDIIKKVDIYKYNLKADEDGTKKEIGFVIGDNFNYAEELTSEDNLGANIYSLASVCVKAIQEQQEEIEELSARIEQLEKEVQHE